MPVARETTTMKIEVISKRSISTLHWGPSEVKNIRLSMQFTEEVPIHADVVDVEESSDEGFVIKPTPILIWSSKRGRLSVDLSIPLRPVAPMRMSFKQLGGECSTGI
jgi:hypothetical protein